jgi:hypothetical protein
LGRPALHGGHRASDTPLGEADSPVRLASISCGDYLGPHDVRRRWGSLLVGREVEPGLVMEWGGWGDWETFREHYLGAYSLDAQQRGREKVGWL